LYGYGAEAVNSVLEGNTAIKFDFVFLHEDDANKRNKIRTFVRLLNLMRRIHCKKILYSGWFAPEYNIYSLFSPREKNVIICESSVLDVSFNGIKGLIKRVVISRMGTALPSGKPHKRLFESVGFKGCINITGGVGIFRKPPKTRERKTNSPLRYIYVGRLVEVKNIGLLIEEFNRNGKYLTVVGTGVLEPKLKSMAAPNISFAGFIDNEKLGKVYGSHDVFILPSTYEPWGLVVEEAVYWGLPVIVSDKVGCSEDIVSDTGAGIIFKSNDIGSLHEAIEKMECNYARYAEAAWTVDFDARDKTQVDAYIKLLQ